MMYIFKHFFRLLLVSIFVICSVFIIISSYFAKDIKENILKKIQQNLENPLILDNVEFTAYKTFPYASVEITNLLVLESKEFHNDTLLFTKRAYAEISLLNIINKIYDVQNLIITNAEINIKYNDLNLPNFLIFKRNPNGQNLLSINKITLLNTNINIKKKVPLLNINWDLERAVIAINNQKYTFNTNGFSKKLAVGATDYMNDKQFKFVASTEITKDEIKILDSDLNIDDVLLNLKGTISQGNTLNLEINGKEQKINQIISTLPENMKRICSTFIFNGKITFRSFLKGVANKEKNPLFEMDYKIIEGDFKLKSIPFELFDIRINGALSNGKDRKFSSTKIEWNLFDAKTKNGEIYGKFELINLNNYFLNSQFNSSWDLTEVNKYFKTSPFSNLEGKLLAKTNYKGNIAFDNRFKKRFLNANHKSDIKLKNVKFNYQETPLFTFDSVNCKLKNHTILVSSCQSTISKSNFNFKGEVLNLIPYILNQKPEIYINGHVKSTYTRLSDIIKLGDASKWGSKIKRKKQKLMPNWLNTNTTIYIKNFFYNNFTASNLTGIIKYKNGTIYGNNLNARSLSGKISGKFTLSEPINNNLKLTSNLNLDKINIRDSFKAFKNYNQKFITKEQIKGIGTAELNITSYWKPNFLLDTKKLSIKSHLVIEKGELIDFKPLEKLSSYVSLEELKHVKFSTLENTINVTNEIVTIPTMEIKSSALSVVLSGTHTFNHEIDYNLTLLLSELLSSSFRQKNTNITEFGEEKKDGRIFNTIYFKMKGDTENPQISLNPIRFIEDVNNSVKKETEKIINIIKEDILQTEKKEPKEEGQEIEIKWDPEL